MPKLVVPPVIVSGVGAAIERLGLALPVCPVSESVAVICGVKFPDTIGVPPITPAALMVMPVGKPVADHV